MELVLRPRLTRLHEILNRNGGSLDSEQEFLRVRDDIKDALFAEYSFRAHSVTHPDNFFLDIRVLGHGKCELLISAGHPMRPAGDDLQHAVNLISELDAFRENSFHRVECEPSHYAHRARFAADSLDDMAKAVNDLLSPGIKPVRLFGEVKHSGRGRG